MKYLITYIPMRYSDLDEISHDIMRYPIKMKYLIVLDIVRYLIKIKISDMRYSINVCLSACLFDRLSACLFVFLSFCLYVFLSRHHSDEMSEGLEVSKVTICVKILKWHPVIDSLTKVRYRAARAAKN